MIQQVWRLSVHAVTGLLPRRWHVPQLDEDGGGVVVDPALDRLAVVPAQKLAERGPTVSYLPFKVSPLAWS